MRKKWKCWSALGLAVLLGCMVPMSTMKAAEAAASVSENSIDDEQETEQINAEDEQETEQINADVVQDELNADDLSEQDSAADGLALSIVQTDDAADDLMPSAAQADVAAEEGSAPKITISFSGGESDDTKALGDAIIYGYINHSGGAFTISAEEQGSQPESLAYYLDSNPSETSMTREQMSDLSWTDAESAATARIELSGEGKYVLYVKAVAENEQVSYARSSGIVVDMTRPVIAGIENGGTYPAGTKFGVSDANLESVLVNENPVTPDGDGLYSVVPNGTSTSCIIRATDKASNEIVYNITVTGEGENPDDGDRPGDDITVITQSGTYSLRAGIAYRLGEGKWTVAGDGTVYRGGSTFYVNGDGDYQFKKR